MKKQFLFPLLAVTMLLAASCKKSDTNTPPAADSAPLINAFFVNIPVTNIVTGSGNYEYGVRFAVNRNGKITRLACKMPTAGAYRVTLWEKGTPGTQIGQAIVTQSINGQLTFSSLGSPVTVTTGKEYIVSLWSNTNWYEIRPTAAAAFAYPITQGNISIKGYQWIGTAQTPISYPSNSETTYVAGLADFEFQAD